MNNVRHNLITAMVICVLVPASVFALPQALLSYYFDDITGITALDSGAFGNHNGTLKQSSPTTPPFSFDISTVIGKYGRSIYFAGNGSCNTGFILADTTDATMLPSEIAGGFGTSFTVSLWFKTSKPSSMMCLFSYAKNGIKLTLSTDPVTSGFYAYASDFAGINANSQIGPAITSNIWHHIAAVVNNGVVTLYYDGTNSNVNTGAVGLNQDLNFGVIVAARTLSGAYSSFYVGQMDNLVIYNQALSAAEVANIYSAKISSPSPAEGSIGAAYSNVCLSWVPASMVSLNSRTVEIATDEKMTNIIRTISPSSDSVTVTDLNENTNYYWRVNTTGTDSGTAFSQQGNIWWFTTAPPCRKTKTLNGDINGDCIVNFTDFVFMAENWGIED
jgi:hypothetical protein